MRGFGAMCLLRKSWRVFLAPQCAALRCPWVSALVLPVVRAPSCARGPPGVLFTAHPHMYNKSVLKYCSRYIKNDDHEPRTTNHQILNKFRCPRNARLRGNVFAAFLAPQCAALRCPWMGALLVPVVRVPSCARGPPCVFVYCTCTAKLYCSTVL